MRGRVERQEKMLMGVTTEDFIPLIRLRPRPFNASNEPLCPASPAELAKTRPLQHPASTN